VLDEGIQDFAQRGSKQRRFAAREPEYGRRMPDVTRNGLGLLNQPRILIWRRRLRAHDAMAIALVGQKHCVVKIGLAEKYLHFTTPGRYGNDVTVHKPTFDGDGGQVWRT
jgi:hypothetical protein